MKWSADSWDDPRGCLVATILYSLSLVNATFRSVIPMLRPGMVVALRVSCSILSVHGGDVPLTPFWPFGPMGSPLVPVAPVSPFSPWSPCFPVMLYWFRFLSSSTRLYMFRVKLNPNVCWWMWKG